MIRSISYCLLFLTLFSNFAQAQEENSVTKLITEIKSIGKKGKNHQQAIAALKKLEKADTNNLTLILGEFNGAGPLAVNWLRSTVETIAGNDAEAIDVNELIKFIHNDQHDPRARALAFDILLSNDPKQAEQLIPSFENDNSLELRRLAVSRLIEKGDSFQAESKTADAVSTYQSALTAARDEDQVKQVATALRDLDQTVDLPLHYGLITKWHIVAPFDYDEGRGFHQVYPPEKKVDLSATYSGKEVDEISGPVQWKEVLTEDESATVDFNKHYAAVKQVIGYAYTEFVAKEAQEVELRFGTSNGSKVWLNGELISENEVYHSGSSFDQYSAKGKLRQGKNIILVKVVQNDQTQPWTNVWKFQLRICDELGTAILSTDRVVKE